MVSARRHWFRLWVVGLGRLRALCQSEHLRALTCWLWLFTSSGLLRVLNERSLEAFVCSHASFWRFITHRFFNTSLGQRCIVSFRVELFRILAYSHPFCCVSLVLWPSYMYHVVQVDVLSPLRRGGLRGRSPPTTAGGIGGRRPLNNHMNYSNFNTLNTLNTISSAN